MTKEELIKQKAENIASRVDPDPNIPKFAIVLVLVITEIIYYAYEIYTKCKDRPNPPTVDDFGMVSRFLLVRKAKNELKNKGLDSTLAKQLVNETLVEISKTNKEEFKIMGVN